jgi:HSP20 family protein
MAGKDLSNKTGDDRRFLTKQEEARHPFLAFQEEMNRLIDNFFHDSSFDFSEKKPGVFTPSIDVTDTGNEIRVAAELPGLEDKDIEVSLTRDTLTIKGEKKEEKEEKGKSYHRMERSYGSFMRTIPLPVDVETDKAAATFRKGILNIILPKTEKALKETKKISIKSE